MNSVKSYAMEYGNRCRQIRMAKGLSQSYVAEKMFTTAQNVSSWERSGISDVDKIKQLSEVLGQDIMADEIDQEGIVGEVGREILTILVRQQGYYEFDSLVTELFGLPADRVSNEIFKLERIGNVVREQYKDWLDKDRDGVFITAKGIITIKNASPMSVMFSNLQEVVPYEKRLQGHINFNDRIHKDEVSRLIWKLPCETSAYRVYYIYHLIDNYMESFPNKDQMYYNLWNAHLLPGVSCYFDILYCMAFGYYNSHFELPEGWENDHEAEAEMWKWEQKRIEQENEAGVVYIDEAVSDTQRKFEELFPWLSSKPIEEINKKNMEIRNKIHEKEDEELKAVLGENYEIETTEELMQPRFELYVGEKADKLCSEWFTEEEILKFVEENYKPAAKEHEYMIDDLISKINKLNPRTMEYYYQFPESWEKNGMAQKIRGVWGLPTKVEWWELLSNYHEETEDEV